MSSDYRNNRTASRSLLFVWLFFSGSALGAQLEEPRPVSPTTEAPSQPKDSSDGSELKIHNYQLKRAKAAEVLKLWKQLHGMKNGATIDERTNSIVFFANDEAARELGESLALLDSETPSPIIPPTPPPVAQGFAPDARVPAKTKPAGLFRKYTFKHAKAADVLKILREAAGGSDFGTDDVEGFVVDERTNSFVWKVDAVSLDFEEVCKKLDTESPEEDVHVHNQERYRRVPVIGPTTEGGAPIALDPPSNDEVIQALEKARPTRGSISLLYEKHGNNMKIVKEKIADYVDPPRLVPLIGMAQLHHAHYKCTLYFPERTMNGWPVPDTLEDKEASEVIYIDHNHFHMCGNRPAPASQAQHASQTFSFSLGFERGESLESLKQQYNELERKAHQLADKLKQSKSISEADRTELQAAVRKSFEARQALQRAELADLAQRMKSMQQSIDMRDRLADKVVQRRVEDLLNPNLKWNVTRTSTPNLSQATEQPEPDAKTNPENSIAAASSSLLPQSIPPTPISLPYDPGRRPETIIMERIQGLWIAESMLSAGKDRLSDYSEPFEVLITGNEMRFKVGEQPLNGPTPILLTGPKGSYRSLENADQPLPRDFVIDPNGEQRERHGIIACDGSTFSLCFAEDDASQKNGFRPTSFIPGSKVTVIKCHRAPGSTAADKPGEADLSTPQATLDYLHRHSLDHPDRFPAECYTDEAVLELSGMMLQNLSIKSSMSQVALQRGGVIGESNGVLVVSGISPAFHIEGEALLKEQILPSPPENADRAFELLATLTFGSTSSNSTASVQVDRQLLRLAAGVLKSPKEFLPAASKLLETFGKTDADVTKSQKANQTQPKADIAIIGDEATATLISSGNDASPSPMSAPRVTKLRRIDGRWLISEILTDEEITELQSFYSSEMDQLGGAEEVLSDDPKTSEFSQRKNAAQAD